MLKILRQLSSRRSLLQTIKNMEQEQLVLTRRNYDIEKICHEQQAYLREAFHEIRNGIHVITGNSDLLAKWTDGCQISLEAMRLARNIREASHSMAHFLNAGMELVKPEGEYEKRWDTLEVRPWIHRIISQYQHHAEARDVSLHCNIGDGFPEYIQMDKMLLRQVITNLLHNAIKFSMAGSRVRIDCFEGLHEWTMVFSNKSIGIGADKLKRIFEPFYTLEHPESQTGLGLSITRKYVQLLEGQIKATCIKDQFVIWLRLPMRIVSGQPSHPLIFKGPERIPVIHSSRKVLVIEDNPLSQRLICNFLHEVGLRQIIVTARAKEGQQIARHLKPDLIFMDVNLPDQSGMETLQALKATLKDTPVIVMTGDRRLSDNAPLLQAGASEYILKPFELKQIAGIVRKYLDFAA